MDSIFLFKIQYMLNHCILALNPILCKIYMTLFKILEAFVCSKLAIASSILKRVMYILHHIGFSSSIILLVDTQKYK